MASIINASTTLGLVNSADTSGVLQLQTANTTAVTVDASQNVGIGVTPSANQYGKNIQVNQTILNDDNIDSNHLAKNAYYNSGWKYYSTGYASKYTQSLGIHSWSTAASGTAGNAISFTQAMTLTATGRLGIGTTTPSSTLDARGDANLGTNLYLGESAVFQEQRFTVVGSTSGSTGLSFSGWTGAAYTERARIDSSGNLLVGTTSGAKHTLKKNATGDEAVVIENSASATPYGAFIYFSGAAPNDATRYFLACQDTSAVRFQLRSNGGLANYSSNDANLSDRREKTNFAPAKSYLDVICAIPVQTFNYIDQNMEEDGGLTLGVVAQDVQAVAPELVMESNWASKDETPKMRLSIYQTDLQYALMKCIQEQQAIIESLKARLDAANL